MKGENINVQIVFTPFSTLKLPSLIDLSLFIIITLPFLAVLVIVLVIRAPARWKKSLRYLRWASKAAFLLLYVVPIGYLAGTAWRPVYSLFFGIHVGKPWLIVPVTQSVCMTWTTYSVTNINPGAWLMCPLGAADTLLTGLVDELRVVPTIIAALAFIIPIVLLGNIFCSWACPLGTIIDSFDKAIEKFSPKIEAKRNKRYTQSRQSKNNKIGSYSLCPACPITKVIAYLRNKNGVLAYGILGSTIVGTIALRISIFCCALCILNPSPCGYQQRALLGNI
jgi:polyferredoxin